MRTEMERGIEYRIIVGAGGLAVLVNIRETCVSDELTGSAVGGPGYDGKCSSTVFG
jgi:hypothetical protein